MFAGRPTMAQEEHPVSAQTALSTAFSYQGRLIELGQPANGTYDFRFTLYDAPLAGNVVAGPIVVDDLLVNDGLFFATLNFGANVFQGAARWLEIEVRPGASSDDYTLLTPRQNLIATPYAIYSLSTHWNNLIGVPAGFADGVDHDTLYSAGEGLMLDQNVFSIASNYRLPQGCANGQVAKWSGSAWGCADEASNSNLGLIEVIAGPGLTGQTIDGQATISIASSYQLPQTCGNGQIARWNGSTWNCSDDQDSDTKTFWSLTGNAGTTPVTHVLGTLDTVTLTVVVSNTPALRIVPTGQTPNLIGGHAENSALNNVQGAVIGGGGESAAPNRVTDDFGTIGGGRNNLAGNNNSNSNDAPYATIGGGINNSASALVATISGGMNNVITATSATIGGGSYNTAQGGYTTIAGGAYNLASATGSVVGGGLQNFANSYVSTVSGGENNQALGEGATIGGGVNNLAAGANSTIAGGGSATIGNQALAESATIGGGSGNIITSTATAAVIAGGVNNVAEEEYATVGGGKQNVAGGLHAVVSGGFNNTASGNYATVAGGQNNVASDYGATVVGGTNNIASGYGAIVLGGSFNSAEGSLSVVAGNRANAVHSGVFLFADSTPANFNSVTTNEFAVRASGGYRLYSNAALSAGVSLAPGSSAWSSLSDRSAKENFMEVDPLQILQKVSTLPIQTWNYKTQSPEIRHIGPMAQDFYALFGLGEDQLHISTIDADGVALAAIQGLYQLLQEKDAQIAALQEQLALQQAQITELQAQIQILQADEYP